MQIVLATTNPHKLEEIKAVFDAETSADAIEWQLLDAVGRDIPEPVEDQPTFEGNATLKARYYATHTGQICLADDSGIEVDALGGAPGVISARYSGVKGSRSKVDPANNAHLLQELAGLPVEQRSARFVCAMCLTFPAEGSDGSRPAELVVRGTVEGRILLSIEADDERFPERGRGGSGFGYDPLFVLPGDHDFAGMTTAQLTPDQKNAISHRGVASRLLLEKMRAALVV